MDFAYVDVSPIKKGSGTEVILEGLDQITLE